MPLDHVYRDLQDGYIHHWLVAGPQIISAAPTNHDNQNEIRLAIAKKNFHKKLEISQTPVERGPLSEGVYKVGKHEGAWRYYSCQMDHLIDLSTSVPNWSVLRAWAYAQVMSPEAQEAEFILTVYSEADVWVNGQHVQRQTEFNAGKPLQVAFPVKLRSGANSVWVRVEQAARGSCAFGLALRVLPAQQPVSMRFPTTIEGVERRNRLEAAFSHAITDRDVFTREDQVILQWPEDVPVTAVTSVRLQSAEGPFYAETFERGSPGDRCILNTSAQLYTGHHKLVLLPGPKEYFEGNRRILREIPIWCVGNFPYFPAGNEDDFAARRIQAFQAGVRGKYPLFEAVSRMALGDWDALNPQSLLAVVQGIAGLETGHVLNLVGLLGMILRFFQSAHFPDELREPIRKVVLEYPFGQIDPEGVPSEGEEILSLTAQILAGQLYPEHTLTAIGKTGSALSAQAVPAARTWMQQRGQRGLSAGDAPLVVCEVVTALSHLADLAEEEEVYELASVLLDKLFFQLAVNAFQGVFGGSSSDLHFYPAINGWVRETAGITRLLWGMGGYNQYSPVTVSLACVQNYEAPELLGEIARSTLEEVWSQQRQGLDGEINKVVHKTPDGMLESLQDYRPGQAGSGEQVWQAALSPSALVFTNHPANLSRSDENRPNTWGGNAVLPRVAQWKDALIAIYRLPENDWMGYTHAHFPIHALEEYVIREDASGRSWAFARKGEGYLALTASAPIQLIETGLTAYRELRAEGQQVIWLCQLGRAALDGSFADFQEKVISGTAQFQDGVQWTTIRGQTLGFDWKGDFRLDGQSVAITGFSHHDSPFCHADFPCEVMEIPWEDYLLKLDFSTNQLKDEEVNLS